MSSTNQGVTELSLNHQHFRILIKPTSNSNEISLTPQVLFPDIDNLSKLNKDYDKGTDPESLDIHITSVFNCFNTVKNRLDPSGNLTKPLTVDYQNDRDNTLARFIPPGTFKGVYSRVWGYRCMFSPKDVLVKSNIISDILSGYQVIPFFEKYLNDKVENPKFDICQFFVFNNNILIYLKSQDKNSKFASNFKKILYEELKFSQYLLTSTNLLGVLLFKSLIKALQTIVTDETTKLVTQDLSLQPRLITQVSFDKIDAISDLIFYSNPNSIREVVNNFEAMNVNPFKTLYTDIARELIISDALLPLNYFDLAEKWVVMNQEAKELEEILSKIIWVCFVFVFPIINFNFYKPFAGTNIIDIIHDTGKYIILGPVMGHFKSGKFSKLVVTHSPFLKRFFFNYFCIFPFVLITTLLFVLMKTYFPLTLRLIIFGLFDVHYRF